MPAPLTIGTSRCLLGADPYAGLRVGLVSSWRLQEASGSAGDSFDSNPLTANNSPGTAAGPGAFQARSLVRASTQSFSAADTARLRIGAAGFTWAGWAYFTTLTAATAYTLAAKWSTGQQSYILRMFGPSTFQFVVSSTGADTTVLGPAPGTLTTGQWYFIAAWYDPTAQTGNLSVNNAAASAVSYTSALATAVTSAFTIGVDGNFAAANYLDGRLALSGLWSRVLTAGERTQLYNGGNGVLL